MFQKDTFRLIRSSFNRFFSLFMIVTVASGFMMGLFSVGQLMTESVDRYGDRLHLQDIQLYSSYGFCDEDVKALRSNEDVKDIFASKFIDAYVKGSGIAGVYRFEEIDRDVNGYELLEGRMPENDGECLLLNGFADERIIGRYIRVYLNGKDIKEQLKYDIYRIVGICKSPAYLSVLMGPSNCDNQELNGVIYLPNDDFVSDYYSTIYLTMQGADGYLSYSKGYDSHLQKMSASVEFTANSQEGYLRDRIYRENLAKLNDAQREFNEEKRKGQAKLDEAKKELDDANIELIVNQSMIDANRLTLEQSLDTIAQSELILSDNEEKVAEGIRQAEEESGMDFETLYNEVGVAYTSYLMIRDSDVMGSDYAGRIIEELNGELQTNKDRIAEIGRQIEELDILDPEYISKRTQLEMERQGLEIRNQVIEQTIASYGDGSQVEDTREEMLKELDDRFGGSVEKTYTDIKTLHDADETLKSSRRELEAGKKQAEEGKMTLDKAQAELNAGKREYEKGLREYENGLFEFNDEIEKAENELNKAREELDALPEASWVILDRESHYASYLYESNVRQMKAIGFAFPLLFFLVAALVCMTTMTRLVDEQRSQIGIYQALGFSEFSIIMKYVIYALLASLGGSVLGIIFGQLIFPTVIYNTWRLMYDLPEMRFHYPLKYILICMLSFSFLMASVTALVTKRSLGNMPAELLRPKAPKISKKVMLEKIGFIWKRLSFTSKLTSRNIFRYKTRFFMTLIGVAGCTGLLVLGFGIKDSISDIVEIQYGDIFDYDYELHMENDHHLSENLQILRDDLNNKQIVPFMSFTSRAYLSEKEDDTLTMIVVDARESRAIFNLRERDRKTVIEMDNSGLILSEKFAINHRIKEGDYLTLESSSGLKREVRVAKICEFYFQHYVFISDALYESTFGENVHKNSIAVSTDDRERLVEDCTKLEDYDSLTDFSGFIEQFDTMLRALDFIILVIVIASGSLVLVVLLNLIQVNISERVREIATFKVLGFFDGEVDSYIFKEIMLLSVLGGLLGLPLGVLEHRFVMNVIDMEMMKFAMNISPLSFISSFMITIVFTLLVFAIMRRRINGIEMVESLKSVE